MKARSAFVVGICRKTHDHGVSARRGQLVLVVEKPTTTAHNAVIVGEGSHLIILLTVNRFDKAGRESGQWPDR